MRRRFAPETSRYAQIRLTNQSGTASALFVHRQLGGRDDLETIVRNRLPAPNREPVCSVREPLLGPLDRGQPFAEICREALVELVLIEVRREVRRVELVGLLGIVAVAEPPQR